MNDVSRPQSLIGTDIFDRDGARIGRVGNVYVDDATHAPEWVTVRTGLFGLKETFVPLTAASVTQSRIKVDVSRDSVREAPRIEAEHGHLSDEQGQGLYDHYGIDASGGGVRSAEEEHAAAGVPSPRRARPAEALSIPESSESETSESATSESATSESASDVRTEPAEDDADGGEKVGAATGGGRHHSSETTPSRYRVSGPTQGRGKHRKDP